MAQWDSVKLYKLWGIIYGDFMQDKARRLVSAKKFRIVSNLGPKSRTDGFSTTSSLPFLISCYRGKACLLYLASAYPI